MRQVALHCRVKIQRQIAWAQRAAALPVEPLGDTTLVEYVAAVGHNHNMAYRMIRCFILQADTTVLTPRWRRLRAQRQERHGRNELDFLFDHEHNHRLADATIPASLPRKGNEMRNNSFREDVLLVPRHEVDFL